MKRKFIIEESDKDNLWIYEKGNYFPAVLIIREHKEWYLSLLKEICIVKNKRLAKKAAENILKLTKFRRAEHGKM